GAVFCAAGRIRFLDGGVHLLKLDAETGELLAETTLDQDEWGKDMHEMVEYLDMPPAMSDILSSRGEHIFMRSQPFTLQGEPVPPEDFIGKDEFRHLFTPTGFLDKSWFHRTYWLYGTDYSSGWNRWYNAGRSVPAGRIMALRGKHIYGFGRRQRDFRWATPLDYHLFRTKKKPETVRREEGPTGGYINPPKQKLVYDWSRELPFLAQAMVLAGDELFVAGPPRILDENEAWKHIMANQYREKFREQQRLLDGSKGSTLWAVGASSGRKLGSRHLQALPVFDGMAAAYGGLYVALQDGRVVCLKD
ncbi:MAG: hypothetical protein V5A84_03340, partial [Planctomycetota bacterium]